MAGYHAPGSPLYIVIPKARVAPADSIPSISPNGRFQNDESLGKVSIAKSSINARVNITSDLEYWVALVIPKFVTTAAVHLRKETVLSAPHSPSYLIHFRHGKHSPSVIRNYPIDASL